MTFLLFALAVPLAHLDTVRSQYVSVAPSESLWVSQTGTGKPVILIPGIFGSAYGYRHVVPLLVKGGFRAIVIEPLGIGFSARPQKADYSLTAQADRIGRVVEQLGVEGAVIVGHSLGASMAFRLAYRRPELVAGIVSLGGGPAESVMNRAGRAAMRFIPWVKWFGGIKLIRKKIRSGLIESSGDSTWVTDEVVEGYTAGAAANIDQTLLSMLAMANAKEPEKLKPRLADVRVPVILLLGNASKKVGPSDAEVDLLRLSLVSLEIETLEGVGLYVQEERPEAVIAGVERVFAAGVTRVPVSPAESPTVPEVPVPVGAAARELLLY